MGVCEYVLDFLPLEIIDDDYSILLYDVEYNNGDYDFNYYVTNKDNTIPYNMKNDIVETVLDVFFKNFITKYAHS